MSYDPPISKDQVSRGLAKLIEQFRNKPKIAALLTSYLNRIQALENAAWEVILYRSLDSAEGAQLDILGKIVGRGRGGLNDTDYRIAIRCEIRINRSSGTPEDLIAVTQLTLPADDLMSYGEAIPATVLIHVLTAVTETQIEVLFDSLKRTKAGGVRLLLDYSTADPENTFTFAPGLVTIVDNDQGWGDSTDPAVGGFFSGILES